LATEAAENGVDEVIGEVITTGRVDPKSALLGMVPGLSLLNRKGGGKVPPGSGKSSGSAAGGGGGGSCATGRPTHSFDPGTPVLMADGSTRPIEDVNVGDRVVATDPETGVSLVKPVTQLHRNTDKDLTNVTVTRVQDKKTRVQDKKKSTSRSVGKVAAAVVGLAAAVVLQTTAHHPFWDETTDTWVNASELTVGHELRTVDGDKVIVTKVDNHTGVKEMRDLTVADTHTYYVLAGNTPVLVHNCGGGSGKTDFYTVQGPEDAARLASGGHPFPTAPERAHFGPGVYAWGNEADAAAYAANKSGAQVMKFSIGNDVLAGLKQFHLGGLSDDAATSFMERNSLLWGGDASHGLDYISRPTNIGTEHYFSSGIFGLLGL
jgi:hypothetical protein